MSKIEVDKVDPQSGTALEIGTSGDTITVPSGVTLTTTNATVNLPATVGGLATGIDVTSQITGVVPTANLGSGSASSSVFLSGASTWIAAGGGSWNLISAQTASDDGQIEFTDSHFTSTYDVYKVVISDAIAATDGSDLRIRVSQSGSYSTTTDYEWGTDYLWYNDQARFGESAGTAFELTYIATGNAAGETFNSEVTIYNPLSTNNYKLFEATTMYISNTGLMYRSDFGGRFTAAYGTALDAFKFYMSTGNITSGLFVLYGLSKS